MHILPFVALLVACGASKDSPAITPPTPGSEHAEPTAEAGENAVTDAVEADAGDADTVENDAGDAPAAEDCPASDTVLLTQRRTSLRDPAAAGQLLEIYDNGHWALSGVPDARTGCLSEADLATLQTALDAAEITAPPLEPGMARCMAMPISAITIEAKGESATWNAPCGPSNPSASLDALLSTMGTLTGL